MSGLTEEEDLELRRQFAEQLSEMQELVEDLAVLLRKRKTKGGGQR